MLEELDISNNAITGVWGWCASDEGVGVVCFW